MSKTTPLWNLINLVFVGSVITLDEKKNNLSEFISDNYLRIPSSNENNLIYIPIRQGIEYKIIFSGVVSVYT